MAGASEGFAVRALSGETWDDFAALVERHNGVWGGCWCLSFHAEGALGKMTVDARREAKKKRVLEGNAHATLVYDKQAVIGWCQFGSVAELPRIKHKKAYELELQNPPDWRLTCFFVDKAHRGMGVADAALSGVLVEIGRLGGGRVEGYPEDTSGRKTSSSFLHGGTVSMFERNGFIRERRLGKAHWVMARQIFSGNDRTT